MIFVVDEDSCAACGKSLEEAYERYERDYGGQPTATLSVYEGTEMELKYVLTPKVKKGK